MHARFFYWTTLCVHTTVTNVAMPPFRPQQAVLRAGDKCIAKYELDGQWYRAAVEKAYTTDPV